MRGGEELVEQAGGAVGDVGERLVEQTDGVSASAMAGVVELVNVGSMGSAMPGGALRLLGLAVGDVRGLAGLSSDSAMSMRLMHRSGGRGLVGLVRLMLRRASFGMMGLLAAAPAPSFLSVKALRKMPSWE